MAKKGVIAEFYDSDYLSLMLTPSNSRRDLSRILKAFDSIEQREPIVNKAPEAIITEKVCSISEALFNKTETLPISKCEGRVFADAAISCPPAIPILISGERIDKNSIKLLKYYGIKKFFRRYV